MNEKALREVIDTYSEPLRAHQLNIELLNTLKAELRGFKYRYIKNDLDSRMGIEFHIG